MSPDLIYISFPFIPQLSDDSLISYRFMKTVRLLVYIKNTRPDSSNLSYTLNRSRHSSDSDFSSLLTFKLPSCIQQFDFSS